MELRRCSASSSNSSSSCSVAAAASSSSPSSAPDPLVSMELEAAEALADLAHLAMRETENGAGGSCAGSKWGSKRKRAKKRVKSESPPDDGVPNPVVDSVHRFSDLALDRADVDQQQHGEPVCRNAVINLPKPEFDVDFHKPNPSCSKSYMPCGGGRSRQNLTEEEKEARRLRRILANRESARQTIRRRQALCEELTRKAADLSWENENLKREKELALKEYEALEITNKQLKAQMAKVIKVEVEESLGDLKSAHVGMPSTPARNRPVLLYNQHPFPPICWPPIIHSSNSVQSHLGPQNAILIPSNFPVQANGKLGSSQQQENSINVNGPRPPLYMVPYPWFFPVHDHGNGAHHPPSSGLKDINDETSVNNGCCTVSSSTTAAVMENRHASLPVKVKSEATSFTEFGVVNDLNETPVGFSLDGVGQCEPHPEEMILTSLALNSAIPAVAVKNEPGIPEAVFAKASQLINSLPEKNQDSIKFPSRKLVDSVTAAEARKRRKELTKLKNLHGRQCRTNC